MFAWLRFEMLVDRRTVMDCQASWSGCFLVRTLDPFSLPTSFLLALDCFLS